MREATCHWLIIWQLVWQVSVQVFSRYSFKVVRDSLLILKSTNLLGVSVINYQICLPRIIWNILLMRLKSFRHKGRFESQVLFFTTFLLLESQKYFYRNAIFIWAQSLSLGASFTDQWIYFCTFLSVVRYVFSLIGETTEVRIRVMKTDNRFNTVWNPTNQIGK